MNILRTLCFWLAGLVLGFDFSLLFFVFVVLEGGTWFRARLEGCSLSRAQGILCRAAQDLRVEDLLLAVSLQVRGVRFWRFLK